MGINPRIALAFSMQANKGAYALLAGSGVSRAASIPTGYEVLLDLIRKVAELSRETCEPDPEGWYRAKFGQDPTYPDVLDAVGSTPTERSTLLRRYFERAPDESDDRVKMPTLAHRAIARLVAGGHIRVVLTTNFDRLFEWAIREAGVVPTVVSTPAQIDGLLPLSRPQSLVIKLHGDYLDRRIRNTKSEVDRYDRATNRLLDRIFEEFGLIVCGWSGEHDSALVQAIYRCRSHVFGTFWATRSDLTHQAEQLVTHRQARVIRIAGADEFFGELAEQLEGMEALGRDDPLSTALAVARVKRYLPDATKRVELESLLRQLTDRVLAEAGDDVRADITPSTDVPVLVQRIESACATLVAALVPCGYWGTHDTAIMIRRLIERMINVGPRLAGNIAGPDGLRRYPALLASYAAGVGALAAENWDSLAVIWTTGAVRTIEGDRAPVEVLHSWAIESNYLHDVADLSSKIAVYRLSLHLKRILRDPCSDLVPDETAFNQLYYRYECMVSLVVADLSRARSGRANPPMGLFAGGSGQLDVMGQFARELEAEQAMWAPIRAGMFGGDPVRALGAIEAVKRQRQRMLQ